MQVLRQVIIGGLALTLAGVVASHASAVEPLPTAGSEQTAVVHALITLAQGDPDALVALPGHLIDEAPAVVDPVDAALARRWTTLLPAAIARLPPARQTAVLTALDVRLAQAGPGALPWDYLPAPAATRAVAKAAAQAFDHGNFRAALAWEPSGDRAAAALSLLHTVLPLPALPQRGEGLWSSTMLQNIIMVAGDGWLFGLDPVGRVQWQRRCERQAQIVVGEDAALLVETAGAAVIAADGTARRLPPLPAFAKPWGVTAACAWFVAGTTAWRVTLSVPLAATTVDLIEPPLGPPVMQGDRAWWLTRKHLLTTESARIVDRLPHLLELSSNAILGRHPHGAVIRDHQSWWRVGSRAAAAALDQAESWLLAGDAATAKRFLDD